MVEVYWLTIVQVALGFVAISAICVVLSLWLVRGIILRERLRRLLADIETENIQAMAEMFDRVDTNNDVPHIRATVRAWAAAISEAQEILGEKKEDTQS